MGKKLTSKPNPNDLNGICNAIAKLDHELNTSASPTFTSVGLIGLTENALMYADSAGVLTSLAAATNGQLIIGNTGAAPSVANLTGTANQIIITPGAGSITLSTPQDIHVGASPAFADLTLTGLSATRLVQTDGDKKLISIADFTAWIMESSANQVIVTDNGDGTITLSLPQDIDTAADVQFGSANITNTATVGRLLAGGITE